LLASVTATTLLVIIFRRGWLQAIGRRVPDRLAAWVPPGIVNHARSALASLDVLRERRQVGAIAVWSVVVWSTATLTNYFVLRALDIQAPAASALVVLVMFQLGVSFSSVPATLGIFEYLCLVALSFFGVGQEAALGYALLLHLLLTIPPVMGLYPFWRAGLRLTQVMRHDAMVTASIIRKVTV
jgi:uncharacterized membrane protein YbhN (UPF0104 family)